MPKINYLVWIILLLAVGLRFFKFEYIPFQNDADELAYVFAGQSLIETGIPISWSSFTYPEELVVGEYQLGDAQTGNLETFTLVGPWFDHPFLLSLITGGWAKLWGYGFPSIPPSFIIRLPMVLLSGLTLWLIHALTKHFYNQRAGLAVLALVGFSPVFIFGQRMIIGENLYIPMILLALYLLIHKKTSWSFWLAVLLTAAAGWAKITGLIGIPILTYFFLSKQEWKKALMFGLSSLGLFAVVYGGYGYMIDWSQFTQAWMSQTYRLLGWSNFSFLLSHPGFHNYVMLDASYYLILIMGLYVLFSERKETSFLKVAIVGAFLLIWMTSAEQDHLGWYKLPVFTLLSIASGEVLQEKKYWWGISLLLVLTAVNNLGLIRYPTHPLPSQIQLRTVLGLVSLPFLLMPLVPKARLTSQIKHWVVVISFVVYGLAAAYVTDHFYQALCTDRHCPVPVITTSGLLRSSL